MMNHVDERARRFRVHARHMDSHHARVVHEASFEGAAVAYLEDFELSAPIDDAGEISVIVRDVETGHEHCFKIGLDSGKAVPRG